MESVMRLVRSSRPRLLGIAALLVVISCSSGEGKSKTTSVATAPPAAPAQQAVVTAAPSGSPVAAATQPPFKPVGKFALAPEGGPIGSKVMATASGLAPNTEFALVWTTVEGKWKLSPDKTEY